MIVFLQTEVTQRATTGKIFENISTEPYFRTSELWLHYLYKFFFKMLLFYLMFWTFDGKIILVECAAYRGRKRKQKRRLEVAVTYRR